MYHKSDFAARSSQTQYGYPVHPALRRAATAQSNPLYAVGDSENTKNKRQQCSTEKDQSGGHKMQCSK